MNKDVIYIDVDDDITAISGKLKASSEKIVALVPPKRVGVLQSAVNLRILQRVAKQVDKRLVLITNDQTLIPLAAGANIPIAKNLQSKPEIPEIAALKVDDGDDIIEGESLPVGEIIDGNNDKKRAADKAAAAAIAEKPLAAPPAKGSVPKRPKSVQKVPNFNTFRKKFFIIGALLLLLIGFLIWAIVYAPRATVEITAKTSKESLRTNVTLSESGKTDAKKATLRTIVVTDKQESSVEFAATGTKEEGEAASGTLTLSRSVGGSTKVPLGSGFSNGDCTFVTSNEVTVPGASLEIGGAGIVPGTVDVKVKATDIGDQCNLSSRSYNSTVKGISARGGAMSGGSKRTLKIVTQADVQKAAEKLASQNTDEKKAALMKKFDSGVKVLEESFTTAGGEATPSPQVGQEAPNGTAKLSSSITYSLMGIEQSELDAYLKAALKSKLSQENNQRVYDTGAEKAVFSDFTPAEAGATATLEATGQVGPQLEDAEVKKRVMGKRFGDIQSDLKSISGIDNVEVKFSPFWVNTVPEDTSKIAVRFKLEDRK
jgi:hypothetical protein